MTLGIEICARSKLDPFGTFEVIDCLEPTVILFFDHVKNYGMPKTITYSVLFDQQGKLKKYTKVNESETIPQEIR